MLELGQIFQVLQASVGDLRALEFQELEVGQVFQVLQASVGDLVL